MHPLVELAKRTVEGYALGKGAPKPPEPLHETMQARAGVFVSLKVGGQLRGCIGTISPRRENIALEVIANAVAAANEDPRFPSVAVEELPDLEYSVDVLMPSEPVDDLGHLDPKRYGVIVSKGGRRGLLLPDLQGVDTVEHQLLIAMQKAGISPDEGGIRIERFEVIRFR